MAIASAAVLGALAWVAGEGVDPAGRERLVRYVGVLVSAALAIGAPHALFPDPHLRALQLSNPSPAMLLIRQLGRWVAVPMLAAVPALVLGGQGERPAIALEGGAAALAVGMFAVARFGGLGPRVRRWERKEAGGWYRRLYMWSPPMRFLVPDPLVPSLLLTGEVFLAGSALAVAGQAGGVAWGIAASIGLLLVTISQLLRQRATFDRAFWISNGVWSDAFRPSDAADARAPLAFDSVYWAPKRVRPSVWAGLVSLDRQIPLGRIAAVGLALLVGVHVAGASGGVRLAVLALYVVVVNGGVALTAAEDAFPDARLARLGGALRWTLSRFLMSVRWLPPLLAAGLLLVWLTGLAWSEFAVWALVDLGVAALSAGLVTFAAHLRFRRAAA